MPTLHTPHEQFMQWLAEPEGLRLEFKEAKNRHDFDKWGDDCVALANEGGGKIILGVSDRRPRQIAGTAAFDEPGRTEAGLHQRLSNRIPVEEFWLPEGRVLGVHVPSRLPGTAWQFEGRYLKRAGDDLAALGSAELLVDGQLTYAALILFGSRAALGRWLAQAEVVFEYRSSDASGPAADREDYREGFFARQDAIWEKIV